MVKVVDKHSGAILFKKGPEERKIEQLERENKEMKAQIAEIMKRLEKSE